MVLNGLSLSEFPGGEGEGGCFFWDLSCIDTLGRFLDGINGIMGKFTGLKAGMARGGGKVEMRGRQGTGSHGATEGTEG